MSRPSSSLGQNTPHERGSLIPRRSSVSTGSGSNGLSRSLGNGSNATPASLGSLSSMSGLPVPIPPSTSAVNRTLKRTSHQAGLVNPTPSTVRKRTITSSSFSAIPSTPASTSAALTSLRADLEASASATTLQRQLTSSQRENSQLLRELGAIQERVKNLEKERAILLAAQDKSLSKDNERESQDKEERKELVASLGEFRERCGILEEQCEDLKSDNGALQHEREIAEEERENTVKQMEVLQEELQKVDEENQSLRSDREDLKSARETIQNLQKELAERPTTSDVKPPQQPQDINVSEVLRKELHHQVQHLRTLEHNNSRLTREVIALKSERANVELLKEEKLSLETKLRRMEVLRKKLAEVEAECGALKREKEEWASYLDASKESAANDGAAASDKEQFSSPAQMAKTLASARIEVLSLQEKLGSSSIALNSRDEVISDLEGRVSELQEVSIPHWTKENQSLKDRIRTLERTAGLDKKELEMLREQIDTYATEEASLLAGATTSAKTEGADSTHATAYDSQKSLQIRHLEELLEAHKLESSRNAKEAERLRGLLEARGDDTQMIDGKEEDPFGAAVVGENRRTSFVVPGTPSKRGEAINAKMTEQIKQNEELQEALRLTRQELAELQAELESLETQVDNLNFALGRGEYNTSTSKVLSFEDNPAALDLAVRTETLENLREENKVLLEKVGELEERARNAPAVAASSTTLAATIEEETVPKQTYTNLQAEKDELLNKIEQAEKSRLRLKEIFSKTAQELRDACRSLFGYRIEPLENNRIKITTVFGGSDYNLIFGPSVDPSTGKVEKGAKSSFQLVGGNDGFVTSGRVQQGLNFWVAERGCLPGFLSSMTLELFEESTRGRTAGYTEGQ